LPEINNLYEKIFKDKVIWITGASSGIGESLVYQLNKYGAKLIISSRNKQDLDLVRVKCQNHHNVFVLPLDIGNLDSLEEKAEEAITHFGYIDILINNAGIGQRALVKDTSIEDDQAIMNVNYFGTVALTRAVLPEMLKKNYGHIVVVSSIVGKYGVPYRSSYNASKHALHGFFDSMRAEVAANNIKITMICPGFIETPIAVKALTGKGQSWGKMAEIPRGLGMSPDECASGIIKAIAKQKNEALVGGPEIVSVYFNRFFPNLFAKIVSKIRVI
jgi:dehydrogenase/reductase SDR family protein 7B